MLTRQVSRTLEVCPLPIPMWACADWEQYAFDDFTIAMVAKALGKEEEEEKKEPQVKTVADKDGDDLAELMGKVSLNST